MVSRSDRREWNKLRDIHFEMGLQKYADGSVLVSFGETKIICSANMK